MKKVFILLVLLVLIFPTAIQAETLTGNAGNVEYASDTAKGLEFAKICAEHAHSTGANCPFWRFFVLHETTMAVYLNRIGDQTYALGQIAQTQFKRWMRQWVKGMNRVFGGPCSVTLKESDGTTVGYARTSLFGGEIKVEFY